jgi:hypothetical protein
MYARAGAMCVHWVHGMLVYESLCEAVGSEHACAWCMCPCVHVCVSLWHE